MNKTLLWVSTLIIGIGAVALWFVFAQTQQTEPAATGEKTLEVAATIFPLVDLVEQVAGDDIKVHQILPGGASPHVFRHTPKQIAELENADLIFGIGHGLDDWTLPLAETIGAEFVTVDNGVQLKEHAAHDDEDEHHEDEHEDEHEDDHDEELEMHDHDEEEVHDHGPVDPHYWLDPYNVEHIMATIVTELSQYDPKNAQAYQQRADEYFQNELIPAINELENHVYESNSPRVIILHDAWFYFADAFGLSVYGVFELSASEEPSPRHLAELTKMIRNAEEAGKPITALLAEPQLSTTALKAFAQDNNLEIVLADPLGGIDGRMSYIELLRYNVLNVFGD